MEASPVIAFGEPAASRGTLRRGARELVAHRGHSYDVAMRLAADPQVAAWLDGLAGEAEDFDWDVGNRTKSRRHGVETQNVEEMFRRPRFVVFAGRIVEPAHDEPRWLVFGQDSQRRRLALIFTRRGDRVRPISCRPMARKERAIYEEAIGGQA